MKKRTYKKKLSRLRAAWKWQQTYIAGHHYRWCIAAKGITGKYDWHPLVYKNNISKETLLAGCNKQRERNRLKRFWGY